MIDGGVKGVIALTRKARLFLFFARVPHFCMDSKFPSLIYDTAAHPANHSGPEKMKRDKEVIETHRLQMLSPRQTASEPIAVIPAARNCIKSVKRKKLTLLKCVSPPHFPVLCPHASLGEV